MQPTQNRTSWTGAIYAILAYASWGVFPIYWKQFGAVSPIEVISHRVLWSMVFLVGLAMVRDMGAELRQLAMSRRLGVLLATALLLSTNWGLFIYGVVSSQVVETSLGYFINPLVNVLLGCLILKERLSRAQILAVFLAACGVVLFGWNLGRLPWIAIGVALTFGFYGLIRKTAKISAVAGVLVETILLAPLACGIVVWLAANHAGHFTQSPRMTLLFVGAGVVTSLPLIWFNRAAQLLRLSTLGFCQYLAPTLQLLVGVVLYHEPFTGREAIAFGLIWCAIAIYLHSIWGRAGR